MEFSPLVINTLNFSLLVYCMELVIPPAVMQGYIKNLVL